MDFRKDINALRAVAVLLVVLFHFSLFGAEGGYIGVDVFFVISGFLMTAIICRKMPDQFSILGFYAARFRRIFPALFVLCAVLLGFGWFFVSPADFEKLAWHASSSVGFFSNIIYKDEAGYFDTPSQFKWLLHTWSLSVEWQFYLIYPLLLSFVYKFFSKHVFHFLISLTILSLIASIYFSYTKPEFAFFFLITRIWEMTAGGVVWFVTHNKMILPKIKTAWVEFAALLMIISSAYLYSVDTMWPSFYAVLPVFGTILVLLYSAQSESKWMINRLVQAIGLWSYSIYLWHWPVVVAIGYWTQEAPFWAKAIGIVVSIFLGFLSYRFVEKPVKNRLYETSAFKIILVTLTAIAIFIFVGAYIKSQEGFPERFKDNKRLELAEKGALNTTGFRSENNKKKCGYWPKKDELIPCPLGNESNLSYIVIGDSHAGSVAHAVADAFGEKKGGVLFSHQCPTVFNAELKSKGSDNNCTEFHQRVLKEIDNSPRGTRIIVANRYSASTEGPNESTATRFGITYNDPSLNKIDPKQAYQKELVKSLCHLSEKRPTVAIKPIPEMGIDVPAYLSRRVIFNLPEKDVTYPMSTYNERHKTALSALKQAEEECGVVLIDPVQALCDQDVCYGSKEGVPYYRDDDHLNEAGRKKLEPILRQFFQ